jgi:hypothetical protein
MDPVVLAAIIGEKKPFQNTGCLHICLQICGTHRPLKKSARLPARNPAISLSPAGCSNTEAGLSCVVIAY